MMGQKKNSNLTEVDIYQTPIDLPVQHKYFSEFRTIAIFGNVGSGKTALAYRILKSLRSSECPGKDIYFVKHPMPELIAQLGYKNLNSLEEVTKIQNCIVYLDEPQLITAGAEYRRDMILAKVLSLARQRDILFIVSSSDTRTFGKRVEAYFDLWLVKDIEYEMTKQRSMIRTVLKSNSFITPEEIHLEKNEYLFHNRKNLAWNGKKTFELIEEWTDELSKPYKTHQKVPENSQNSENIVQKNCSIKVEAENGF